MSWKKYYEFLFLLAFYAVLFILGLTIPGMWQPVALIMFYVALGQCFNIFLGLTGYVDFGYVAFLAMGAYGMAIAVDLLHRQGLGILIIFTGLILTVIMSSLLSLAVELLRLENVSKNFGGLAAVNKVSLSVQAGESFGIVGPNGSGKTTLYNLISGVYKPDEGKIYLAGKEITNLPPHARARLGIARTFQIPRPFNSATVLENVAVGAMFGRAGAGKTTLLLTILSVFTSEDRQSRVLV
jgi:ABC-type multidrug transport system fused ATPase/permease subunit